MTGQVGVIGLDASQMAFTRAEEPNIRLLAPAGCGKTLSLLYRCAELAGRATRKQRFLLLTFTNSAADELRKRIAEDSYFADLKEQAHITTLNAWGWERIRRSSKISSPNLLDSDTKRFFAMRNQLQPVWGGSEHLEKIITRPGNNARRLMDVMDNLKSMGFDHTKHTNRDLYQQHLEYLDRQGLSRRIDEQFDLLTSIGVLDRLERDEENMTTRNRRNLYERFFIFWRRATERLLSEATFTFDDQKYWSYLDIVESLKAGAGPTGIARYDHVLVDEFQDVNPLDIALIKAIRDWHRATLTIVGDDDQAIYEWRGATPEYILNPSRYLDAEFTDYQLRINYRSPSNIVEYSQNLIRHNKNRVDKAISAAAGAGSAEIEVLKTDSIKDRLEIVTELARNVEDPGKVAVISRRRSQLIPYEIHFAAGGPPIATAIDLDVYGSEAFDGLMEVLEIWERTHQRRRSEQVIADIIALCNTIRRRPLSKKNSSDLRRYFRKVNAQSLAEAVSALVDYDGDPLSGKSPTQLSEAALAFVNSRADDRVSDALLCISDSFDGLRYDWERDDIWFTAPPLKQLAEICLDQSLDVDKLLGRIEDTKRSMEESRTLNRVDGDNADSTVAERPLHLMTATRAKGREFETVIIPDVVRGVWPDPKAKSHEEEERRLFYVAFTRAVKRIVLLTSTDPLGVSPYLEELGLSDHIS